MSFNDQYPDTGFNNQQPPPPQQQQQQQQPPPSKESFCKKCFTNKGCKCFIVASVFVVAPLLIGVVGVMCPIFLITFKVKNPLPPFIFAIYCFLFGILLLLVEFKIRIFGNIFVFLLSYFYKAIFIMFLGTLAMGGFEDIPKWSWIGYVVGAFIILIGILQIIVGCCDRAWADTQQKKMDDTARQYGWDVAPPIQAKPTQPPPQQNQYDSQGYDNQGYNNQGYNNQGFNNQGFNNQGYSNQGYSNQPQQPPQSQGYDPNRSGMAAAASMPETQRFAAQAGGVAARAYIGGASRDEAMNAAMSDPNVQRAAGDAVIAGARNDQVRGAAISGASNAASTSFGYAYDSMFD